MGVIVQIKCAFKCIWANEWTNWGDCVAQAESLGESVKQASTLIFQACVCPMG